MARGLTMMVGEALLEAAAGEEGQGGAAGAPRSVEEYLALPYTIRVTADPTGGYVASVEELLGCVTQGESWADMGEMIRDAMRAWIGAAMEDGRPVPLPRDDVEPARILVRLPRSLPGSGAGGGGGRGEPESVHPVPFGSGCGWGAPGAREARVMASESLPISTQRPLRRRITAPRFSAIPAQ